MNVKNDEITNKINDETTNEINDETKDEITDEKTDEKTDEITNEKNGEKNHIENNIEFEDKKTGRIKHIGSVAVTIICTLLCIIGLLVLLLYITGGRIFAVKTASMQDVLPVGSIVIVAGADAADIEAGQIIGFWMGNDTVDEKNIFDTNKTAVVHRVIENDTENRLIYTKGDGNNTPDGAPVTYENIIGKVLFFVPYVGYPFILLGGRTISIILMVLILLYILFDFFRSRYGRKRESVDK